MSISGSTVRPCLYHKGLRCSQVSLQSSSSGNSIVKLPPVAVALSSFPREGSIHSLSVFVELCIDSGWKQRADVNEHYLRPQEREIFSEIVLMDLKLEGINPVMQENVTNIRKQGRLAWGGVFETGHLLWSLLSSPPLPSPP